MTESISYSQFRTLFVAEQYQYFQDNDYIIYVANANSLLFNDYKYIPKKEYNNLKNEVDFHTMSLKNYISKKTYIENDFLSPLKFYLDNSNTCEDNINIEKKFIYEFYKTHPECEEHILKLLPRLLDKQLVDIYEDFITTFAIDKNETIELINKFPKSVWRYNTIPLNDIQTYFLNRGFQIEDFNEFLFTFLHNRESQVNDCKYEVRDFLMKHFNEEEEKLISYFNLLPVLKAMFIEPDINILINTQKFSDVLHLGMESFYQSFLIEKLPYNDYENILFKFCDAIQQHYHLDCCTHESIVKDIKDHIDYYSITFFHNNENINKKNIERLIIDYFKDLRNNPEYIKYANFEDSWLLNRDIENKVPKKEINFNKKKI